MEPQPTEQCEQTVRLTSTGASLPSGTAASCASARRIIVNGREPASAAAPAPRPERLRKVRRSMAAPSRPNRSLAAPSRPVVTPVLGVLRVSFMSLFSIFREETRIGTASKQLRPSSGSPDVLHPRGLVVTADVVGLVVAGGRRRSIRLLARRDDSLLRQPTGTGDGNARYGGAARTEQGLQETPARRLLNFASVFHGLLLISCSTRRGDSRIPIVMYKRTNRDKALPAAGTPGRAGPRRGRTPLPRPLRAPQRSAAPRLSGGARRMMAALPGQPAFRLGQP